MMLFKVILFCQFFILGVSSNENHIRFFFNNVLQCVERLHGEATDSYVHERLHGELRDHIQTLSGFLSIPRFVEDSRNREAVNTLQSLYGLDEKKSVKCTFFAFSQIE